MKLNLVNCLTLIISCGLTLLVNAQENYYSGFDTDAEQEGWTEYKTAATTFSHWGYSTAMPFSPSYCIGHDYSPATGITVTDNWFVSPSIVLSDGGTLDSIQYRFSGFSVPGENDTIAIYLLVGSQNPSLATSKQLLFDFRGADYVTDNTYRKLAPIALPTQTEACYIGIRYLNSNCSDQWLTVAFDNIGITHGGDLSVQKADANFLIYPNPTTNGSINLESNAIINAVSVFDVAGNIHYNANFSQPNVTLDLSAVPAGIYFVNIQSDQKTTVKRLVVQN